MNFSRPVRHASKAVFVFIGGMVISLLVFKLKALLEAVAPNERNRSARDVPIQVMGSARPSRARRQWWSPLICVSIITATFLLSFVFVLHGKHASVMPQTFHFGSAHSRINATVFLGTMPGDRSTFPGQINATLTSIAISEDLLRDAEKFCIVGFTWIPSSLFLPDASSNFALELSFGAVTGPGRALAQPLCIDRSATHDLTNRQYLLETNPSERTDILPLRSQANAFFYPYDGFFFSPSAIVSGNSYDAQGKVIGSLDATRDVNQEILLNVDGWLPGYASRGGQNGLILKRPLILRGLPYILCALLFTIVVSLPFVADVGIIAQIVAALIFGLWGIRDVLIPKDAPGDIALNQLSLAIYAIIAVATFVAIIRIIASRRARRLSSLRDGNNT